MRNLSGKDYPNERTISLWFVRPILSQYKSKNCSQNVTIMVTGCKYRCFFRKMVGLGGLGDVFCVWLGVWMVVVLT